MEEPTVTGRVRTYLKLPTVLVTSGVLLIFVFLFYWSTLSEPPGDFPVGKAVVVKEGSTMREAAEILSEESIIRSDAYLQFVLQTRFDGAFIRSGSYVFPEPLSAFQIAEAVTTGKYSTPLDESIITFPEGFRIKDMHSFLPNTYADENLDRFFEYEGYLFPDTYFIEKNDTLEDIVHLMRTNFDTRIETVQDQIDRAYYSLEEIVILASILEREGNSERTMRIIAGILLKRLEAGMPLQVDAAFEYILGKTSAELTEADLNMDSPYNTYTNTGLPPTPISNPGLIAIRAVLNPIETDYYYYLSDEDGDFHYAEDFEEHRANKFQYLR